MATITVILPFAKVLAAFAIILLGIKRRLGLAPSILAGGWFLALVFGLSLVDCGRRWSRSGFCSWRRLSGRF